MPKSRETLLGERIRDLAITLEPLSLDPEQQQQPVLQLVEISVHAKNGHQEEAQMLIDTAVELADNKP